MYTASTRQRRLNASPYNRQSNRLQKKDRDKFRCHSKACFRLTVLVDVIQIWNRVLNRACLTIVFGHHGFDHGLENALGSSARQTSTTLYHGKCQNPDYISVFIQDWTSRISRKCQRVNCYRFHRYLTIRVHISTISQNTMRDALYIQRQWIADHEHGRTSRRVAFDEEKNIKTKKNARAKSSTAEKKSYVNRPNA
jgi:hypothetical protein